MQTTGHTTNHPVKANMKVIALSLIAALAVSPAQAGSLHSTVAHAAASHGVPAALAHGVVMAESRYQCGVTGGGAKGIMQVKPATARGVGVHGNLHHCATGIEAGMRVLRKALASARGSWCGAATIFNQGSGSARSCSAYGRRVLRLARSSD